MLFKIKKRKKDTYFEESFFRRNMQPNQLLSFLLAESYIRNNDNVDWFSIFKLLQSVSQKKISKEKLYKVLDDKKIGIEVLDTATNIIGGQFDLLNGKVIIQISKDLYLKIFSANDEWLENLAANFWINFVHEDTHRQQQNAAGNYSIRKKYKSPSNLDWTEDLGKDLDYFDQQIEADAYGREIGARLEILEKNKSVANIFLDINSNSINDEYCKKIINVYKDPRISKKVNKSFFRALYDFLVGNEN